MTPAQETELRRLLAIYITDVHLHGQCFISSHTSATAAARLDAAGAAGEISGKAVGDFITSLVAP